MKTIIYAFLTLIPFLSIAQSGPKNFLDVNYIEVTGQAEMEVTPDEIYLNIQINEKDNKAKQSLEDLEKQMIRKLEGIGIDISKQLTIKDFASNFKYYWLRENKIYTSKEYQLIVHDGATAGKVFQELEQLGISNISIEKLDHSEIEKFKMEVKVNAIKAAKEKASAMAEAIDQTIGRAIYIQEQNFGYRNMKTQAVSNIMIRGVSSIAENAALPEVEFEKIKLEYSVLARFDLRLESGRRPMF